MAISLQRVNRSTAYAVWTATILSNRALYRAYLGGSVSVILALTHSYLLNRQDQPECSHCDCALTVAHVLLECNHYNVVRQRYFNVCLLYTSPSPRD